MYLYCILVEATKLAREESELLKAEADRVQAWALQYISKAYFQAAILQS
jgi:hypothetical protein